MLARMDLPVSLTFQEIATEGIHSSPISFEAEGGDVLHCDCASSQKEDETHVYAKVIKAVS